MTDLRLQKLAIGLSQKLRSSLQRMAGSADVSNHPLVRDFDELHSMHHSVGTLGDFDQVITKLSLNRAVNLVDFATKNNLIEFCDHLARSEFSQRTALFSRRAC